MSTNSAPQVGIPTPTSPGTEPVMVNKDGTTINSGGAAGTLASADQNAVTSGIPNNQPASFTPHPAVPQLVPGNPLLEENTSTNPGA
jgi:hypothetical protein